MDLVQKLESLNKEMSRRIRVIDPIRFEKGNYFLSIQASEGHYCTPRKFLRFSDYTHFEVMAGIPTEDIPKNWRDKYGDGCDVFGWVPKEEIEKLLDLLDEKYQVI